MKKSSLNPFDWFSALCIFTLFILASSRLGLTEWADRLDVVGWLLILGAVTGYLLGRRRIHWVLITIVSIISSVLLFSFSFISMLSEKAGFVARILDLWQRLNATIAQLLGNQPVTDSILFLLVAGILFWAVGISTGLTIMRSGKPWIPLGLLGIGVLFIEHYQPDPRRAFYSWSYALVLLILLGRSVFLKFKKDTKDNSQVIGNETEFDFMRGVLVLSLVAGFAALLLPRIVHLFVPSSSVPTNSAIKWETFTQKFENVFFSLDQNQLTQEQQIAEDLSLGTGQILGDEPVLYIQTNTKNQQNYPFYWRGKSYSLYNGKTWTLGNSYKQFYHPLEKINKSSTGSSQIDVKVWVQSLVPELTQVYTTGSVINFSRTVTAAAATEAIYDSEIMGFFVDPPIKDKEIYRFETKISIPTGEQLSKAGTDYPDWVTTRYLQVPGDISTRITELTNHITSGKTTPYDKAVAITQFLRTNYEYQAVIPAPPRKTDPVEWFLFDYKKGFCNYFASAEVLLLRAAGIPARLSVGYAQGAEVSTGDGIIVKMKDSHAWPEVYFPDYGWIAFEPTPGLSNLSWMSEFSNITPVDVQTGGNLEQQLNRNPGGLTGEDRANLLLEQMEVGGGNVTSSRRELTPLGILLISLAGLILAGGAMLVSIRAIKNWEGFKESIQGTIIALKKRVFRIPIIGYAFKALGLPRVERNFAVIEYSLIMIGEKIGRGMTPAEMADLLVERIPDLRDDIYHLLENYQLQTYSKHLVSDIEGSHCSSRILKSSIKYWWSLKKKRFARIMNRLQ